MLARMTRPKRAPIMRKHLLVELSDDRALRREGRYAFAPTEGNATADLSRQPRAAGGGAPDHRGGGGGGRERGQGPRVAADAAVHRHWNCNAVLDHTNRRPIRPAVIELAARAPMHGDQAHAGILGAARELG